MHQTSLYASFPGYESMLTEGEGLCHPPVLSDQHPHPETQPSCPNWEIPALTKDDAQQAFIKYASDYCYSTQPAEEGVITSMEAFDTYRYRLETYIETRTKKWSVEPYLGETIDASEQTPPGPWELPVNPPPLFFDGNEIIKVPYTSSVKECYSCHGFAEIQCRSCSGTGLKRCCVCAGSGSVVTFYPNKQVCATCYGHGRSNCWDCKGKRRVQCNVCSGKRRILVSIHVVVDWFNGMDEYVVEQSSGLKMVLLRNMPGHVVFTDSNYTVYPVTNFPNAIVAETSERLQREHRQKYWQTSRVLQQRQTIELIPITKVTYQWRGESHVFFVYGRDFRVSAEDYPDGCCDGCCTMM